MIAWTLFFNPMPMPSSVVLWLVIPLCATVATVYKAIRIDDVRKLPGQIISLLIYMVCGLALLAGIMWLITAYWP